MDGLTTANSVLFEAFRFDRHGSGLLRQDQNGVFEPVAIGSRALELLGVLIDRRGDLVAKGELMDAVWPGTAVEDNNLAVQISTLRRLLDHGRSQGSCIQTVPGRGYRFVAPVTWVDPAAPVVSGSPFSTGGDAPFAEGGQPRDSGRPDGLSSTTREPISRTRHRLWHRVVASITGTVVLLAVVAAWNWPSLWSGDALPAPRLSIVVLPFANLSDDREQQYFADGITDDLTTDLSRISDSFVISRNTAFTYKDKPVEAKQIGRELRVRYVVDGSLQRSGKQVRVNVQLIDAETDAHLWAERFDRDTGALFAVQNEITGRIANSLGLALIGAEAAHPTADPDALDYILRGRAALTKGPARDNLAEAVGLFERALTLDPRSVGAQGRLANALMSRVLEEMTDTAAADVARAEALIGQVLAASPNNPVAHFAKGQLLRSQGRCEEALLEYETVSALDRNSATALINIGRCRMLTGLLDEAIPPMAQAARLSPRDPFLSAWYSSIAQVYVLQSHIDEALVWLGKSRSANPGRPFVHIWLAAVYGLKGETERAAAELAEARQLSRDDRYSSLARLRTTGYFGVPKIRALFETTYIAGLRRAGVPEE